MERLIQPIRAEKEYKELFSELLAQSVSRKPLPALLTGLTDGARCAFYVAATLDWKKKKGAKTLIIVPDEASGFLISTSCRASVIIK